MKKVLIYTLALVLAMLTFTSCSFSEELSLLSQEFDNITEFFLPPMSDSESKYPVRAVYTLKSSPLLGSATHAEIVSSPFNPSVSPKTVSSVGITARLTTYDSTRVATEDEKNAYTIVKQPTDRSLSAFTKLLDEAHISYDTVYRENTAPSGEVFAIEYAGFSCSDGYFLNPSVSVTLYVSAEKRADSAKNSENLVYITFDDGPSDKNTTKLLDILDTYGVKAAFFTMGNAVEKYPSSAREIVERGHIFACHSVTHDYKKIYASTSALEEEITEWESIVENAGISVGSIGQLMFRFPGGSVGNYFTKAEAQDMKSMLERRGYLVYDWNVVTNDSILYMAPEDTYSYDYMRDSFTESLNLCLNENKSKQNAPIIVLMHETVDETVDLLPWVLEYFISGGYTFGDLRDLGVSWTFSDR